MTDELAVIAQEAVALEPDTNALLDACLRERPSGQALARDGARIASRYLSLRRRLRDVPRSADRDRLDQLVNYHHQLVEGTLELAYRDADVRRHLARQFDQGLGPAAAELRELAGRLVHPPSSAAG